MFSFNEALRNNSPGRVLMAKTIEWAKRRGIERCDLMVSTLHYKHRWTDRQNDVTDFLIPCSGLGAAIVGWYSSGFRRWMLKRVWRNSSRRRFGKTLRPFRPVVEAELLSRWGDPFQNN